MELWMSGEIQSDISNEYRLIRKNLEQIINEFLKSRDYGKGLIEWNYIAIIREIDSNDYNEILKYNKRKTNTEFRLKIPHEEFKNSDLNCKTKMICQSLLRSLDFLKSININNFDIDQFIIDIKKLFEINKWI